MNYMNTEYNALLTFIFFSVIKEKTIGQLDKKTNKMIADWIKGKTMRHMDGKTDEMIADWIKERTI